MEKKEIYDNKITDVGVLFLKVGLKRKAGLEYGNSGLNMSIIYMSLICRNLLESRDNLERFTFLIHFRLHSMA